MKIFLDSIGCRLNQSEIEQFANQFRAAGHSLVAQPEDADLVVVNTCLVTGGAVADTRKRIRQVNRSQEKAAIWLTGCWATLDPKSALALPGVAGIIPNDQKDKLVHSILELPDDDFDLEPLVREPLPGIHLRTRAFIKVQDGCNQHCTFCMTRLARGKAYSRKTFEILKDIRFALRGNTQEIVLTGVQLGFWGNDLAPKQGLANLIESILSETKVKRLRLSSIEPWDVDEHLLALWKNPRLCRHLHLPLQSGSTGILRRMGRTITTEAYEALVKQARETIPDLAITTDIMVGFPGETPSEFEESSAFIEKMGFAGGHVFIYSERPGTPAAGFPGKVPLEVRKVRSSTIRAILEKSAEKYRRFYLGKTMPVIWEAASQKTSQGWLFSGLTDNYLRVYVIDSNQLWNTMTPTRLDSFYEDGFKGTIITTPDIPEKY